MALKAATFVVLSVAFFAAIAARPYEDFFDCTGKGDGIYGDPSDNRSYYVCLGSQPTVHLRCRAEQVFDSNSRGCINENGQIDDEKSQVTFVGDHGEGMESIKTQLSDILEEGGQWSENGTSPYLEEIKNVVINENTFPGSIVIIGVKRNIQENN